MTRATIFDIALGMTDPVERAAFLDRVCAGQPDLRREIDGLLAAQPRAGSLLQSPFADVPTGPYQPAQATIEPQVRAHLAPATRADSLGRLGHYEILAVLGEGGFGVVYRAFDEQLQRVVAVKVLNPALAATSPPRKRFLGEARAAAGIRDPNVVQVHDVGEAPLPYLVMEFIPGETLQQRLDRTGPLDLTEVLEVGRQIASGLAAAHAHGVTHRDIKPANILIEGDGPPRVKITDFGLARVADAASATQSGNIVGTPLYMAPEQAEGGRVDHRADLFSLGSVLYALLTGRPPFRAESLFKVLQRVVNDTPRPIRELVPGAPRELCDLIARLHAKSPDERFQSAGEVATLLSELLARRRDGRLPDTPPRPTGPAQRRRVWPWVAALVGVGILAWFLVPRPDGTTPQPGGPPAPRDGPARVPVPVPGAAPPLAVAPFDEGTAQEHQAAWARHLGVEVEVKNSLGMRLRLIPPGTFTMGDPAAQKNGVEAPAHKVTVTQPFYLGVHEVTCEQYKGVGKSLWGGLRPAAGAEAVTFVTWHDAREFCTLLSARPEEKQAGRTYRLPVEIEWEYACRAGTTGLYYFGPIDRIEEYAWIKDNGGGKPQQVGLKKPNAWGLHDTLGNVQEWCADGYKPYRADAREHAPSARVFAEGGSFFLRGGSVETSAALSRCTFRPTTLPDAKWKSIGFRVVALVERQDPG